MSQRLLFPALVFISIILLSSEQLCAQKEEGEIIVLSERVGEVIDLEERNRFNLFSAVNNFRSAILLKLQDGSYAFKITYVEETTGEEKIKWMAQTELEILTIREYIDHYKETQSKTYHTKSDKESPIVPGARIRISTPTSRGGGLIGTFIAMDADSFVLDVGRFVPLLSIPLSSVQRLELSQGQGKVYDGRKGRIGTGIGILGGGVGTYAVAAMSDDPRLIYGIVGAGIGGLDGFLLGSTGKNAGLGFFAGAMPGLVMGGALVGNDIPGWAPPLMGAGFFGHIGMIIGAIVQPFGRSERWEEIPLEKIRVSICPDRKNGFSFSASFVF